MSSKNKNNVNLLIGGIVGFLIGIGGNLISAWIQQDLLKNSFTPLRILAIVLCSLVGIFIMKIIGTKENSSNTKKEIKGNDSKNSYSGINLAWSKLKTKGKNIKMDDVSAIGSDIDIDTE